jgi:preprotein translocase subunit SecE
VARDRKRAKQRRERQARAGGHARRADAATTPSRDRDGEPERRDPLEERHEQEPPELASGDTDLADVQLALGRPELGGEAGTVAELGPDAIEDQAELAEFASERRFEQLEDAVDEAEAEFEGREEEGDGGPVVGGDRVPRERRREGNRVTNFLRGSWRELQRVQWPDRRAVAQATAVVVGFVVVAGAFLGLMDLLAGKIVDLII